MTTKLPLTAAKRKDINEWCDQVIGQHFSSLPKWVNRDLFYASFREELAKEVFSLCWSGETEISVTPILVAPLMSDNVNNIFDRGVGLNDCESYEIPDWWQALAKELPTRSHEKEFSAANVEVSDEDPDIDPSTIKLQLLLSKKGVNPDQFTYDSSTYEKSLVLMGDTKPFKETIKEMGGKWNANLKCGPGWIFAKKTLSP